MAQSGAQSGIPQFQITLNINQGIPGKQGDTIYASGSVNSIIPPSPAAAYSGYLTWNNYTAGTNTYPVTVNNVSTLTPVNTTLTRPVNNQVQTTIGVSYPPLVKTTIMQSIPVTYNVSVGNGASTGTEIQVSDSSHLAKGMFISGGMTNKGDAFNGGTYVTEVGNNVVTVSQASLVPVQAGAPLQFRTAPSSNVIKVASTNGIVSGMTPSGGMQSPGNAFAGGTTVVSATGNMVTLSQQTLANVVTQGSDVSFTTAFTTGTTSIQLNSVVGILRGMIPSGGMTSGGNAFAATSVVVDVDATSNTVTISQATVNEINAGANITFTPSYVDQLIVGDTTGINPGMSIRGGASSPTGDSFSPDAFVTHVDAAGKTITISVMTPVVALVNGSNLQFFPPVPAQSIGTVGTPSSITLTIPADKQLTGARIIFSVGTPGNFPFNSSNQPIAPVPYKGNVKNKYYDFIEFAWTFNKNGVGNLNYDTSIVDQFGIPITIEFSGINGTQRGITCAGTTVFTNYQSYIASTIAANISGTNPSAAQVTSFFNDLSTVMAPYRILAPADGFLFAADPGAPASFATDAGNMNNYFDVLIKKFFDTYDQSKHPDAVFQMSNVAGSPATGKAGSGYHDLTGFVTTTSQKDTGGVAQTYRVLQLTDNTPGVTADNGNGWVYHIYEPFFSSNGYAGKPLPPFWLIDGMINSVPVPTSETPTMMVFGASGVFADSDVDGSKHPSPAGFSKKQSKHYQTLLGAIENQIVTAINRGIVMAPQWRWLFQAVSNSATLTPQVTVNAAPSNSITIASTAFVPVCVGMSVVQTSGAQAIGQGTVSSPNIVTSVSVDDTGASTVTLSMPNVATSQTSEVNVAFSYANVLNPFYQKSDPMAQAPFKSFAFGNDGVWNYFSQFFHLDSVVNAPLGVSIGGLAYAYAFDDQGNFSTDISMDNPPAALVTIGAGS